MSTLKLMKKIKGSKSLKQMTKAQRREYARLRESVRRFWIVSKDKNGTVVYRNKEAKLYGITPAEFAQLEKQKKSVKKSSAKKRRAS